MLLAFGAPIAVDPVPLTPQGEPAPADVRALTGRIQAGLDALVLQAESDGALALAAAAEQLLTEGDASSLAERVSVRQRLLAGRSLAGRPRPGPARAAGDGGCGATWPCSTPPGWDAPAPLVAAAAPRRWRGPRSTCCWLPLALAGVVLHFAAWHAVDRLAHRFARGDQSMDATLKLGLGLVLYPATWLGGRRGGRGAGCGAGAGLLAGLAGFFLAAAAVAFDEGSEPVRTLARAAVLRLGHRGALARLRAEREALRAELLAAAALIPEGPAAAAPPVPGRPG